MIALELSQPEAYIIGAAITGLVAVVGYLLVQRQSSRSTDQAGQITLRAQDLGRIQSLEDRVGSLEDDLSDERSYSRSMWAYCRKLVDQYYRWRKDGAPDPDPLPPDPAHR